VHRIDADLRDHYWYDELVQETIAAIEAYLALWAAVRDGLGETAA
jgi:hypothetical protein